MEIPYIRDSALGDYFPTVFITAVDKLERFIHPSQTSCTIPPVTSVVAMAKSMLHLSRFQQLQNIDGEFRLIGNTGLVNVDVH